uniref:Uncharacterized protein n=1 Tax=Anguilla anguilla TaxID=7936 RepID=A0A0E9U807_ANGAN
MRAVANKVCTSMPKFYTARNPQIDITFD